MYLDINDNVTVGVGTLLRSAESAAALPFRHRSNDRPATSDEIIAEFGVVDAMVGSRNRPASDYGPPVTKLYLLQEAIDRLVAVHIRRDFGAMLRLYPDFGNLLVSVQVALWDLIYNLGQGGFADYRLLRQAIRDGNWEEAARQSHRDLPDEERNQYVFNLFMEAADAP